MALRVLSRITGLPPRPQTKGRDEEAEEDAGSEHADAIYKVIDTLVQRGFLEAGLPLIERKNHGRLSSTKSETKGEEARGGLGGLGAKDLQVDQRQMDAWLAGSSCEVLSDIVAQGSGYLTHVFRAHLFEPLLILATHGRSAEQDSALYTIMTAIQIASGSYQTTYRMSSARVVRSQTRAHRRLSLSKCGCCRGC